VIASLADVRVSETSNGEKTLQTMIILLLLKLETLKAAASKKNNAFAKKSQLNYRTIFNQRLSIFFYSC
jgi:hypothetical protein